MGEVAAIPNDDRSGVRDRRGLILAFLAALLMWRFVVIGPIELLLKALG